MADVADTVTGTAETLPSDGSTSPVATGDIAIPGYVIGERLGAGGFGVVVAARHEVIGREVAIKILHAKYSGNASAITRFVAEARAVNRITHPGIVEIFDFGQLADGRHFCIMERLRGRTLRELLRERTRLPLAEALPILRGIAVAVDAAHAAGVAHRDLKPENVFVVEDGSPKLIDFGLAKLTAEESMTETGAVLGTPLYMSPEQCRGKAVEASTDAYSLGALAYHVLVGEPPFSGDALQLALHHLHDEPQPPSQRLAALGAAVDRVVLSLMAKDPAQRPTKLAPAIDALAGDAPLPAKPRRRRRWQPWAIGALGAAGAGIAITLVAMRGGSAPARQCALATEKLAGVWDAPTRASAAALFEAKLREPYVEAAWKQTARSFDGFATRWTADWEAACASEDRTRDPLLYAQRIACLETALVDFTGATASLASVEPASFAAAFTGNFRLPDLEDCALTSVLRAQLPPPPPDQRAEITSLLVDVHRARAQVRKSLNAGMHDELDRGLARLETIANRLEALGSPTAGIPLAILAAYLFDLGERENDPAKHASVRQRASATLDRTIRVSEAMRNERVLADAHTQRAHEALEQRRPVEEVEAALSLARAALSRAGTPPLLKVALDQQRAMLAARKGNFDEAIEILRATLPVYERWVQVVDGLSPRNRLAVLLHRAGRHGEAVQVLEAGLALQIAAVGSDQVGTSIIRQKLAFALEQTGMLDRASELLETERATQRARREPGYGHFLAIQLLDLALRRGRSDLVTRLDGELAALDPLQVVRSCIDRGRLAALAHVQARFAERAARAGKSKAIVDDALAIVAYMLGDRASMERHARRVEWASSRDWLAGMPLSPWLVALADAHAGRRAEAEAALAKLATVPAPDPGTARALTAEARIAMRDPAGARTDLEAASKVVHWRGWSLAEIDARLGLAHLEMGDVRGALPLLEAAHAGLVEHVSGFHFFAPMAELALARALWDTGGDKRRARDLAARSREHAARMPHRTDEVAAAEQWLAVHPL